MSKLKDKRIKKQFTQQELANKCCVKQSLVSYHEKKGVLNTKAAKRYAEALGCDWRELLD